MQLASSSPPNLVRIVSYNIHKGIGGRDRRYRLERIAAVLEAELPHVMCLQEVDRNVKRSAFDHQADWLAHRLGDLHKLYQFNVHVQEGGYGNLVLSRFPIVSHHHISLTLRSRKARGAQLVTVQTPGHKLVVVNWHLGLAEAERQWQARRLLEHHHFQAAARTNPTIVIGDTNDWRNRLTHGPFAIHHFHQVTAPPSRFRSFPAWLPVASLDKAFIRGDLVPQRARCLRTRLTRDASDHLPLEVDLLVGARDGNHHFPT